MNKTLIGLGNQEIFSKNLSRYVKESGKTQMEIAKAVGISRGTFCDYVKGRAYPRMDKVQKLSEYFGIKISDLVDEKPSEEDVSFAQQQEKLLDLFGKVPEEKREFVLSLIQATIENLQVL